MSKSDRAVRASAEKWFKGLTNEQKWQLGDELVLGTFDGRDWGFDKKPTPQFLRYVEEARFLWESTQE